MSVRRVWLVTGASTGIGRCMVEHILREGNVAVATARRPEMLADLKARFPPSQLLVLNLDVTQVPAIKDAFKKAKEIFGRVDVVFNNAGWSILGDIEASPEDEARSMFDTNFWGAANVSREAIRIFREENKPAGGLLIQNSSEAGIHGIPGLGYYSASKHALEGFTVALAQELDPEWNIQITLVEPGAFRTEIVPKLRTHSHSAYSKPALPGVALRTIIGTGGFRGADPAKGVKKIYDLASLSKPPLRFPLGKDAVEIVKGTIRNIREDVAKYELWSQDLDLDVQQYT